MNLPSDFVLPNYQESTIANMPATVARLLDVPFDGLPPMRDELWQPVAGDVKRVVVILLDAFGWNIVQRLREELAGLDSAEIIAPITSVYPSTTANALSSVWTGTSPAQHGLVGFKLFLPEFGTISQMIALSPDMIGFRQPGILIDAGLDPELFLATPGSGEQFSAAGVATHDFKGRDIMDSALSKMHGRGVGTCHGIHSFSDMLSQAREVLENAPADEKCYLHLYWPIIDTLSHIHGPFGTSTLDTARVLLQQIESLLLSRLSPNAREGTVVCLMADHGQTEYHADRIVMLSDHPRLEELLLMQPSGDVRFPYLFAKQGKVEGVIEYVNRELGEFMTAISAETALSLGLYGGEPYASGTRDRLGDVVLLMHEHAILMNPGSEHKSGRMVAGHGGLSRDEMEAPWIVWRLG